MKIEARPVPLSGSKGSDDLWLEVICLTSPEIAGSPRNIYRYSGVVFFGGVEH